VRKLRPLQAAWWDAFHGTAQPLFREAGDTAEHRYVHIYVDEVGYQAKISPDKASLYTGAENVPAIDEATQGTYYGELVADDGVRPERRAPELLSTRSTRPASRPGRAGSCCRTARGRLVQHGQNAIMANQQCSGTPVAMASHGSHRRWQATFKLPQSFLVRAAEGFSYDVKITRPTSTRRLTGAAGQGEAARDVLFKLPEAEARFVRVTVTLHAESNPDRTAPSPATFRA